jgi:DNA gyrase subunit B/topoisomerase-4 subunit B
VTDNGRGVPVDKHPQHKKTALELIFSTLHAAASSTRKLQDGGRLHGVGASVVNALSNKLVATVKRDGSQWQMEFKRGKPTGRCPSSVQRAAAARACSSNQTPPIFPRTDFNAQTIP